MVSAIKGSPGKSFSKSQSCAMKETFSNFTQVDPLLIQNDKIRLASHNYLHFIHFFFFSMFLSPISTRMPNILRHSLLKYYSLAWHFCSRTTSLSESLSLTFLEICRSDSSLQNLVFNSFRSFFSSSKILLNFPW